MFAVTFPRHQVNRWLVAHACCPQHAPPLPSTVSSCADTGVAISTVIIRQRSSAAFSIEGYLCAMARLQVAKDLTILENNAVQSIATAAGYMTGPLISALMAYMFIIKPNARSIGER